jgi:hypothetical protein
LLLDHWAQLADAYAPYSDTTSAETIARLDAKQQEVLAWWTNFKRAQQKSPRPPRSIFREIRRPTDDIGVNNWRQSRFARRRLAAPGDQL